LSRTSHPVGSAAKPSTTWWRGRRRRQRRAQTASRDHAFELRHRPTDEADLPEKCGNRKPDTGDCLFQRKSGRFIERCQSGSKERSALKMCSTLSTTIPVAGECWMVNQVTALISLQSKRSQIWVYSDHTARNASRSLLNSSPF